MVNEVNAIIGDALLGGTAVTLPGIGTLRTEYVHAVRGDSKHIAAPYRKVVFSSAEDAVSLTDEIADAAGVDAQEADRIYRSWLDKVRRGESLAIEGVGELNRKSFILSPEFECRLNPQGRPAVRTASHIDVLIWLGVGLALAVTIVVCCYIFVQSVNDFVNDIFADRPRVTPVVVEERQQSEIVSPAADSVEVAVTEPADSEKFAGAEQTEQAVAEHVAPAAAEPVNKNAVAAPSSGIGRTESGRCYVVYGVYSTEENAARASAEAFDKGFMTSTWHYGGDKFLVTVCDGERSVCTEFLRLHRDAKNDFWIYVKK